MLRYYELEQLAMQNGKGKHCLVIDALNFLKKAAGLEQKSRLYVCANSSYLLSQCFQKWNFLSTQMK